MQSREDKVTPSKEGELGGKPVPPGYLLGVLFCLGVVLVVIILRVVNSIMARCGLKWSGCFRKPKRSASRQRSDVQHDECARQEIPPYLPLSKEIGVSSTQPTTPPLDNPSPYVPVIAVTDIGADDLSPQHHTETVPLQLQTSSTPDTARIHQDQEDSRCISLKGSLSIPPSSPRSVISNLGISQRSSHRLESMSSVSPSTRPSITSDCSLSLEEFPLPPSQLSLPSAIFPSLARFQDGPRKSWYSPFSFPTNHRSVAVDANNLAFEISNQGRTYALPSITGAHPSGYRDNSSSVQASSITFPLYPRREDDDHTSSPSRCPSCQDSVITLRGDHSSFIPVPALSSPPPAKLSS